MSRLRNHINKALSDPATLDTFLDELMILGNIWETSESLPGSSDEEAAFLRGKEEGLSQASADLMCLFDRLLEDNPQT